VASNTLFYSLMTTPGRPRYTLHYTFSIGSGVISWFNRKQRSVALSSVEAKYMAISLVAFEALWLRKLLLGLFGQELEATVIHCDNQSSTSSLRIMCFMIIASTSMSGITSSRIVYKEEP
jgi:hypothetical protein